MPLYGKRSPGYLWVDGDSYAAAASSPSLGNSLNTALGRGYHNTGNGGDTITQVADRVLGAGYAALQAQCPLVIWDGQPSGPATPALYLAQLARIVAVVRRVLFVFPVRRSAQTTQEKADTLSIQQLIVSAGYQYVDAQAALAVGATLPADAADVAANVVPTTLMNGDGVHLVTAGMDLVVTATTAKLASLGW